MSSCPIQHRALHRSRHCRFALGMAMLCGATLVWPWPSPFDSAFRSPAHAEGPAPGSGKVQPKIVDFAKRAKQKAEARRLLQAARSAAANGDFETAHRQASQAARIPVEWNLGEVSPQKFLEDLDANSEQFAEPKTTAPRNPAVATADADVVELTFPNDRAGTIETADEDLSLIDTPKANERKTVAPARSSAPAPSQAHPTAKPKAADPGTVETTTAPTSPRKKRSRFEPIPTLEDLAKSAPEPITLVQQPDDEAAPKLTKPDATTHTPAPADAAEELQLPDFEPGPPQIESAQFERPEIFMPVDEEIEIPAERVVPAEQNSWSNSEPRQHDIASQATPATPTTVIHEFRLADRTTPAESEIHSRTVDASQFVLMNLNSFLMAGLFGALLLLIVVAGIVLRRFGPNPQFTFKVELNQPHARVAVEPVVKTAARTEPTPSLKPLKLQVDNELEQHREDAMMQQVFEDNLKLREELEDSSIAA